MTIEQFAQNIFNIDVPSHQVHFSRDEFGTFPPIASHFEDAQALHYSPLKTTLKKPHPKENLKHVCTWKVLINILGNNDCPYATIFTSILRLHGSSKNALANGIARFGQSSSKLNSRTSMRAQRNTYVHSSSHVMCLSLLMCLTVATFGENYNFCSPMSEKLKLIQIPLHPLLPQFSTINTSETTFS